MNNLIYNIALILTIIGGLNWGLIGFVRLRRRGFSFRSSERFEPYRIYFGRRFSGGTHFFVVCSGNQIVGYQITNDTSEVKFKKKNPRKT